MDEPLHPIQIEALKKMSVGAKVQAICDMWELARQMLATGTRMRHPDWDEAAVWEEVRRRLIHGTS
jgi:hypothetical protein